MADRESNYQQQIESTNYDQDDYDNLEEIERAMNGNQSFSADEYVDDDDAALAELEEEMQHPNLHQGREGGEGSNRNIGSGSGRGGGGSFLPAGAMPSQNGVLSVHAKEFWFPECRNCACCKGFKHGCECCLGGVDTCTKSDCVSSEHTSLVASQLASRQEVAAIESEDSTKAVSSSSASSCAPAPSPRYSGSLRPIASDEVCKFFISGGCRFGDSCRNVHPGVPVPPTAGGQHQQQRICHFFLAGNCTYGNSCRNLHTQPPPAGS